MQLILLNNLMAFLEGFALILSPCILPILPILLSGGITGGKHRPLGIICGFVIVFAIFTFSSRFLVQQLNLNLDLVRYFAFALIALFGVIMFSDYLSTKFSILTSSISNFGLKWGAKPNNQAGFGGGLLLGAFTSLVWVPCGGPILATAIIESAIQKSKFASFMIFFFFALGSIIPMILISLLGRTIIDRFKFLKTKSGIIRKVFGIIIILGAAFSLFIGPGALIAEGNPKADVPDISNANNKLSLINALPNPYSAPEIIDPDPESEWINSQPLTIKDLRGKVVLVDFWTYSCINCVRTLPYLKSWYAKYQKDGLIIIGVHTPEFEFEKNIDNVKNAVIKYGIVYPVVLDNNYGTWLNYNNQYWPADYLIDKNGKVVYQHFGEGDYDEAEHNIRMLLGLKDTNEDSSSTVIAQSSNDSYHQQTPETYLGYNRAESFNSLEPMKNDETQVYNFPQNLPQDTWAIKGIWNIHSQYIQALTNNNQIKIHFNASKVYLVAGTINNKKVIATVMLNGKLIGNDAGSDVKNNILSIDENRLYDVVNVPQPLSGVLDLTFNSPDAQLYTFTFGN